MAKLRVPLLAEFKKQRWRRVHLPLVLVLMGRRMAVLVLPLPPTKKSIPVDPPTTLRKRKSHTNTGEEDDLLLSLQRRPRRRYHQLLTNEESAKRSPNDGRRKVPAGGAKMTESDQRMNANERKGETGAGRVQDQETAKGISTAKRVRRVQVAEAKAVKPLRIASRYAWRR